MTTQLDPHTPLHNFGSIYSRVTTETPPSMVPKPSWRPGLASFNQCIYHPRMIECPADDGIPFAKTPKYTEVRAKAAAACNSALLLEMEGYGGPEETSAQLRSTVHAELTKLAEGKESDIANVPKTPAGAIYVQSILSKYDTAAIANAQTLRYYVTNKLIIETDSLDPRVRIKALELLGKITDVGLFTDRSEVTVHQKSNEELTNTLKDKLKKLMTTTEVEDAVLIKPPMRLENVIDAPDL